MTSRKDNKFKLTDRALNAYLKSQPDVIRVWDSETPGLNLWVSKRDWFFTKKINGKTINRKLGDRALCPIPVARERAIELHLSLTKGIDPLKTAAEAKATAIKISVTLGDALEQMLEGAAVRPSTAKSYRRAVRDCGAFREWRDEPLVSITPEDVMKAHGEASEKSPSSANKDARTLRAVWNWARKHHGIEAASPTDVLGKQGRVSGEKGWNRNVRRKTAVLRHQLPEWFDAIRAIQMTAEPVQVRSAIAMEVMILTGLRASEVLEMQWKWVNWSDRTITIPDPASKNHMPLTRPMTARVVSLLKTLEGDHAIWVFPGEKADTPLYSTRPAQKLLQARTGQWTPPNDMRRTFASAAPAAGIAQHTIKALLNHLTDNEVTQGYQVVDLDTLLEANQAVENYILTQAGMLDKSLDVTLSELIGKLDETEKRKLIFQLSASQVEKAHG